MNHPVQNAAIVSLTTIIYQSHRLWVAKKFYHC